VNNDVVSQAHKRLAPFSEQYAPKSLSNALRFLIASRNMDAGWGRLPGGTSELRPTVLALSHVLTEQASFRTGELENSIEFVCAHIQRDHRVVPYDTVMNPQDTPDAQILTSIEDTALVANFLTKLPEDKHGRILPVVYSYLVNKQRTDGGWGEGKSRIDVTASVLDALLSATEQPGLQSAINRGATFLTSAQHPDGGWGILKDSPVSVPQTAIALLALARVQESQVHATRAKQFLITHQASDGSWSLDDQSDVIVCTALTIRSLLVAGTDRAEFSIQLALRFLLKQQAEDGGWGWAVGDSSEVEPTSTVIRALLDGGVNEFVPLSAAIDVLKSTLEENVELRQARQAIEADIEFQVQQRIKNIIETKEKLELRAVQLETENRRAMRQLSDLDLLRSEAKAADELRRQATSVRRLLYQAITVMSDSVEDEPLAPYEMIEQIAAEFGLNEKSAAQVEYLDLIEQTVSGQLPYRELPTKLIAGELGTLLPPSVLRRLSDAFVSLMLKPSKNAERQLREIHDRVSSGNAHRHVRSYSDVAARIDRNLYQLPESVRREFLFALDGNVAGISPGDAKLFREFLERRVAPSSRKKVPGLSQVLDDIERVIRDGDSGVIVELAHRLRNQLDSKR
jgi:hypothetical protein